MNSADAQRRPGHLVGRPRRVERTVLRLQAEVDPVDHHQTQPVQQHHHRQQQRVGVAGHLADDQVGEHAGDERHRGVGGELGREVPVARRFDRGLGAHHDQHGEHQQDEFGVAPGGDPGQRVQGGHAQHDPAVEGAAELAAVPELSPPPGAGCGILLRRTCEPPDAVVRCVDVRFVGRAVVRAGARPACWSTATGAATTGAAAASASTSASGGRGGGRGRAHRRRRHRLGLRAARQVRRHAAPQRLDDAHRRSPCCRR